MAITVFTGVLAITVMALSIIGLTTTPSGPFNAIVQFGATINEILLGTSFFVLILDLASISALCKKTKEQSVSQSEPTQSSPSAPVLPDSKSHNSEPTQSQHVIVSEEINERDCLSQLPEEILLTIFRFLGVIALTKCSEVSRKWRRLASEETLWKAFDLKNISPLLKVFDESDWVTHVDLSAYGLSIEDAPPLNKRRVIPDLKRCLSSTQIEGNAGITLLTIPKGLTFNILVKLAESPKVGNKPKFRHIWDRITNEIGDIPVDKTYRIVITNNVLKKSRNLSFSDHKALLCQKGYEMPKVLEATVLLVVTFIVSGERLYNDNSWTYGRCLEQPSGYQLAVGGFSPNGICVRSSCLGSNHYYGSSGVLRRY
jgi:hypothetical protein